MKDGNIPTNLKAMEKVLSGRDIIDVSRQIGDAEIAWTKGEEIVTSQFTIGTHRSTMDASRWCELVLSTQSRGELALDIDGQTHEAAINPGVLTFVPSLMAHKYDYRGHTTNTVLAIDMGLFERVVAMDPDLGSVGALEVRMAWTRPAINRLIEQMHHVLTTGEAGWRVLGEALSLSIAHELLTTFNGKEQKPSAPPPLSQPEIDKVVDFIEADMERNFDLSDLSAVLGRDQFAFSRAFRAATGESPHQYVIQRRLMRAKDQLANSANSLADIAYATGFASQSHMTATFSKHVGMPPGAYRKAVQE
ncbi:MAG: AraC family transcriptional regulator [Pseudomonadota bacterium]